MPFIGVFVVNWGVERSTSRCDDGGCIWPEQAPLSDWGELGVGKFRVNKEAKRIQELALLHQLHQHRVAELTQLAAVGMPESWK